LRPLFDGEHEVARVNVPGRYSIPIRFE
jgi:hypothetical protein